MSLPFKNGFAMLVALLVFVASSRAAICEMACETAVQRICCQAAPGGGSDVMDMASDHCSDGMSSMAGTHDQARSESGCSYVLVSAVESDAALGVHLADVQWAVVSVAPIETAMSGRERVLSKSPPLRLAWVDPLFVSLRV